VLLQQTRHRPAQLPLADNELLDTLPVDMGLYTTPRGFDFGKFGHSGLRGQSFTSALAASSVSMASLRLPMRYWMP
jgi:hypothetical protein